MDDNNGPVTQEKPPAKPHSRNLKILTTAAVFFGNISLGHSVNAIPPSFENIRLKYGAEVSEMSIVFTIQTVSYCIGALSYGFVSKFVKKQPLTMASLAIMAFVLYMIPNCPTLPVFCVIASMLGFVCGLYDALQIVWIIEMWQEKSGPLILAQHFFFAIGSNIPSVLIAPFLATSRIVIPYSILGGITTLALLSQVLLFIFCRYYTPPMYVNNISSEQEQLKDNSAPEPADSNLILGIGKRKFQLIVISGLFLGGYVGMEVCTLQFIPIFGQYSRLQMTDTAAAYVLSGLIGTFAVGRGVGILIILKMQPEMILCVNLIMIFIANVILLVWANTSLTMFWVAAIVVGAGYSTMYPAFCAFMERYIVFTDAIGSFFVMIGGAVAAIYPLIVGRLIEERAVVLTYTNFFSTSLCILAILWACLLLRGVKSRV